MSESMDVIVLGNRLNVHSDSPYLGYHQSGTKNKDGSPRMPQRKVLPNEDDPMPARWESALEKSVDEAFKKAFK